jgi:hypothetical protein
MTVLAGQLAAVTRPSGRHHWEFYTHCLDNDRYLYAKKEGRYKVNPGNPRFRPQNNKVQTKSGPVAQW